MNDANETGDFNGLWIGCNDRAVENDFRWVADNSSCGVNRSSYSNWGPGEPNDANGEHCTDTRGGEWNDLNCAVKLSYLCQKPYDESVASKLVTANDGFKSAAEWNNTW